MAKKNSAQLRLFEQPVYEYFVLLSPSDKIKEDVDAMKQALHAEIGLELYNLNSIAHVSLFKKEALEDATIIRLVKKAAILYRPFTITVNGYDILKHGAVSRTICLKIEDPEPVCKIINTLAPAKEIKKSYRQISILDRPKRENKVNYPHIAIASKIPTTDFKRIEEFSHFDYRGEWLCNSITILRRPAGSTGYFSPCKVIPLG